MLDKTKGKLETFVSKALTGSASQVAMLLVGILTVLALIAFGVYTLVVIALVKK